MSTHRGIRTRSRLLVVAALVAAPHLRAASPVPLEQVRGGDPEALRIALLALPHGKGKVDRALLDALQEALIVKPTTVLRAIAHPRQMRLVCGPSVQESYDLIENSLVERQSAVVTALINSSDPNDKKRFSECADELDKAESRWRKSQSAR